MRWTMDIITYARDKSLHGGLPLGVLLFALPSTPDASPSLSRHRSETVLNNKSSLIDCGNYRRDRAAEGHLVSNSSGGGTDKVDRKDVALGEEAPRQNCVLGTKTKDRTADLPPGTLCVYSAGVDRGTSVKLHVTPHTTAQEIVNLVVHQLTRASFNQPKNNNEPPGFEDCADGFRLVLSVGTREHELHHDFRPLQLQNPWTRGSLYLQRRLPNLDPAVANCQTKST